MRWHNVLLLAAAILISGCKEEKLAVGALAPALAAFDLQGQESGLERWQGKAVYLNFWSAGCGVPSGNGHAGSAEQKMGR